MWMEFWQYTLSHQGPTMPLHNSLEKADFVKVIDLGIKVLEMPEHEVPDQLFISIANFTLTVAHDSDTDELKEKAASSVLGHRRRQKLPEAVIEDAITCNSGI